MKYLITSLLLLGLTLTTQAQGVYGYSFDTIEQVITTQPGLYQELGQRYMAQDTTLEGFDYLLLYYGSAFTEDYAPYGENMEVKMVDALVEEEKYEEAISVGQSILKENPALAGLYYSLLISHHLSGDTLQAQVYYDQYASLLSIPFYSGTGMEMDSAFVVRSVNDEYLIMQEIGYQVAGQSLVIDEDTNIPYDVLKGVNEFGEEVEIYFNIYLPYTIGMRTMLQESSPEEITPDKKKKKKEKRKKKKRKNKG